MCVLKQPSASRLLGVHREIRTTRTCRNAIHFLWFLGVIREWGTARQIWLICLCVICICCPSFYAYLYFLRIELRVHREWGSWSVHILYLYCRLYFVWHVFVIVIRGFTHTESGGGATLDRRTLGLAVRGCSSVLRAPVHAKEVRIRAQLHTRSGRARVAAQHFQVNKISWGWLGGLQTSDWFLG